MTTREKIDGAKRRRVLGIADGLCWYCGCELEEWGSEKTVSGNANWRAIDHQTSLARGGTNTEENLVPACTSCNSRKGSYTLEEYRVYMTLLVQSKVFFADGKMRPISTEMVKLLSHIGFHPNGFRLYKFYWEAQLEEQESVPQV